MSTPLKLGVYALGLAGALRRVRSASAARSAPSPRPHRRTPTVGTRKAGNTGAHGGGRETGGAAEVPGGLQVTQDGYRLMPLTTALPRRRAAGRSRSGSSARTARRSPATRRPTTRTCT